MSRASGVAVTRFDYAILDAESATLAKTAANLIRVNLRNQVDAVVAVGTQLNLVKAALEHGHFLAWIGAEFPFSERTARNFMRAAEVYGEKSATVADLPLGLLYQLQSPAVPEACRNGIIERREAGEALTEPQIKDIVAGAKQEARLAALYAVKEAKLTPKTRAKRMADRERAAVEQKARWDREEKREKEATDKAAALICIKLGPQLIELNSFLKRANLWDIRERLLKAELNEAQQSEALAEALA